MKGKLCKIGLLLSVLTSLLFDSTKAYAALEVLVLQTISVNFDAGCSNGSLNPFNCPNPNFRAPPADLGVEPAGMYTLQVLSISHGGANGVIYSGDEQTGTALPIPNEPGRLITFNHLFGHIVLFDAFPYETDPEANTVVILFRGVPPCQVNVTSWKQFASWGSNAYDHSYAANPHNPVSATGQMELVVGLFRYLISLSGGSNNLRGLADSINLVDRTSNIGVNAVIDKHGRLSLYNTGCINGGTCFPRFSHELHLCDGSCQTGADILTPKKMSEVGCAVTALAMAFDAVGVKDIATRLGLKQLDPGELNEFMSNTEDLLLPGGVFTPEGNVDWANTPHNLGVNLGNQKFQFDGSLRTSADLDNALCTDGLPVIVKVQSPHGSHYIVVTAKQGAATDGSQYSIEDPGFAKQTLADYGNSYELVGVVRDPTDSSQFNLSVGDNADILVTDSSGRRTGFDVATGQILREIPASSYLRTDIDDDVSGGISTGLSHSIQVLTPVGGSYTIAVNGIALGFYKLSIHAYSQDGSTQPIVDIQRLAGVGSSADYQIQFSPQTGAVPQLVRAITFQSTIDDIGKSLQLGLIQGKRLADRLSDKIERASEEAAEGQTDEVQEILRKFRDEVSDRTPRSIKELGAQILLEDADSLLDQLPKGDVDGDRQKHDHKD